MVEGEAAETKEDIKGSKKSLTEKIRKNPWVLSTFVMGLLIIILLVTSSGGITGKVISENKVGEYLLSYYENMGAEGLTVDSVEKIGGIYEVNLNYQGDVIPFYVTKSGYIMGNELVSVIPAENAGKEENAEETIPISECVAPYGITTETIIFYHSDSCGWCSKMKPGVENLEKEGYKFYWAEISDSEASKVINNCVKNYITSGGVPQFICVKTGEIHIGAFADEESNLDQSALKEWVDACLAS